MGAGTVRPGGLYKKMLVSIRREHQIGGNSTIIAVAMIQTLITRIPRTFLASYRDDSYLIRQKAYALFWILIAANGLFVIPIISHLLLPGAETPMVLAIDIALILAHLVALVLLKRGRLWLAGDLSIVVYAALWFAGMAIKTESFLRTGTNSFNYLVFAIIVFAAVFSRPRVIAGVTVLAIGIFVAHTIMAWHTVEPETFVNIFFSQAINIFIAAFGSGILLTIIRRITDRSMALTEAELRKNRELSASLESMVTQRTQELMTERNVLRHQKSIMDREMNLAARIQRRIIPAAAPREFITFQYRPLEQVGGDFFDFVSFPDQSRIGVFICDVSGHGVPAALITSMIKSTLLQLESLKDDPAQFLAGINDLLYDMVAGNFVTAFYGVYDRTARRFRYASAGHYPPYIVTGDRCVRLMPERSLPLAVYGKRDLEGLAKEYRTRETILDEGSTLVFYTDGLIEAQNSSHRMFGDGVIDETLAGLAGRGLPVTAAEVYEALVNFRGEEQFDDDICIICLRA